MCAEEAGCLRDILAAAAERRATRATDRPSSSTTEQLPGVQVKSSPGEKRALQQPDISQFLPVLGKRPKREPSTSGGPQGRPVVKADDESSVGQSSGRWQSNDGIFGRKVERDFGASGGASEGTKIDEGQSSGGVKAEGGGVGMKGARLGNGSMQQNSHRIPVLRDVSCPVCAKKWVVVSNADLNSHIDACLSGSAPQDGGVIVLD